jgi:DNA (cytosine-5)-methyltransferase 1
MQSTIPFIELFAGVGGMSVGFESAGFECILAVDIWKDAIDNFNHNREKKVGRVIDISLLDKEMIKEITGMETIPLVTGGPPCQGISNAGNRDIMDHRNFMIDEFYRVIKEVSPEYFVMENVAGIISMKRPESKEFPDKIVNIVDWIKKRVRKIGYELKFGKLYAHWYGVGQARPRVFFVGWKPGNPVPKFPPVRTHSNSASVTLFGSRLPDYVTVNDVLNSIPSWAPNQDLVYKFKDEEYIEKVKKLKGGESVYENFKESHRRLWMNRPAFTIKENHGSIAIHPTETRMINLREMSAFQGFPMDFEFIGSNRTIAKMIGNSVPVGLARAIAIEVKKVLDATGHHRGGRSR